jgi:benzoyl-CoA reductase subunit BamC
MKKVRMIKIDADKCSGCRACEAICSAYHADPKYSMANPERARIRIFFDEANNVFVPVMAGAFTEAECNGRSVMIINGKEYPDCTFCRDSCPSRNLFKEPDSGLPLDMCGEPPLPEPMCVKWCQSKALTYIEKEEPSEDEKKAQSEKQKAIEALVKKYGEREILDLLGKKSEQKG